MACWVVPAIAAELWGVTVNHVLAGIRDGSIASRNEHGFVFVDAVPGGYTYHRPRRADEPPLPTYVLVQPVDAAPTDALPTDGLPTDQSPADASHADASPASEEPGTLSIPVAEDDELPPLDLEEDDIPLPPRDAIRAAVARQRRRPLAA
jgi:hypothetical protein